MVKNAIVIGLLAAGPTCLGFLTVGKVRDAELERLATENTELRVANARQASIRKLDRGLPPFIDARAAGAAAFDMGTPASMLMAVRRQEAGVFGFDLGVKCKTATWCAVAPPTSWQYYESARVLNRLLWDWAMADPMRRDEAMKALSVYTAPQHRKDWAKGVSGFEFEARGVQHPASRPAKRKRRAS